MRGKNFMNIISARKRSTVPPPPTLTNNRMAACQMSFLRMLTIAVVIPSFTQLYSLVINQSYSHLDHSLVNDE